MSEAVVDAARIMTATDIGRRILKEVAAEAKAHGPDPELRVVVAAGIVTAIQQIEIDDPLLGGAIIDALQRRAAA